MEKYIVRKLDNSDEEAFNEFIFEHVVNDEEVLVCDNSLISKKPYIRYASFSNWYEVNKMIDQYHFAHEKVKASTYLLYRNIDERNRLVAVFEIRHNLTPNTEKYGNISINIRPTERGKGYYAKSLNYALTLTKELNIDKVNLVVSKDDLKSIKTIKNNFDKAIISEDEEHYTFTFYNKKVNNQIETEYLDNEDNIFSYVCTDKLYDEKVEEGAIGYSDITSSIAAYFTREKPFGYLYILDNEYFRKNEEGQMELSVASDPYDVVKITHDEFIEFQENKKLIK